MLLDIPLPEGIEMYDKDQLAVWHMPAERENRPASTLAEAVRLCRGIAGTLNASSFSLLFSTSQGETRRLAPVFDSSFPGLSPLSRAVSGRSSEGVAHRLSTASQPLWWRQPGEPSFLSASALCWAVEIDAPADIPAGIAFPVSLERDRSGGIVFAGDLLAVDETGLCDAHARCFSLFDNVARQRAQERAKVPAVSKRELECLRLTANGLTSDAIATALGLSVHTANQYLTNSTHKLNAVNRVHAVAKALRSGLID